MVRAGMLKIAGLPSTWAEMLKLAGLPSAWTGAGLALALPSLIAFLNRRVSGGRVDHGFQELAFGVIGVLVLGAVCAGSEYRGRQILTSLLCVPSRGRFLAAKTGVLVFCVAVLAVASSVLTLGAAGRLGAAGLVGAGPRVLGVVVYWVLTALLAYGITLIVRSGILPLTVLILNTSVVSVTFLLSKATPLAGYLPDLAGSRMFLRGLGSPVGLTPLTGGLVMAAWAFAVLTAAVLVMRRRDA